MGRVLVPGLTVLPEGVDKGRTKSALGLSKV